jgi:hypothetical protein
MSNMMKYDGNNLSVSDMRSIGEIFVKSGLFGSQLNEAQAVVKIMAGREIGLEPFAAMQGIDIISGKVVMKPIVMAAKIKSSGKYDYRILTETAERCEIAFYQGADCIGTSVFTMRDAEAMGLAGKDNWRKQPAVMLYNRAMSKGARQFCPDVFFGVAVYSEGEIEQTPEPQGMTAKEEIWTMNDRRVNDILDIAKRTGFSIQVDVKQYLSVKFGIEISGKKKSELKALNQLQYETLILAMENDTLTEETIKAMESTEAAEQEAPEPTEAEKELELV